MEVVEVCYKIYTISWMWGMPITSLHNHVYGFTQSRKRRKLKIVHKIEEENFVFLCEKNARDWPFDYVYTIKIKSCKDNIKEEHTIQE